MGKGKGKKNKQRQSNTDDTSGQTQPPRQQQQSSAAQPQQQTSRTEQSSALQSGQGQPQLQGPRSQPAASVQSAQGQPRHQGPRSQPAASVQSAQGQPRHQGPRSQPATSVQSAQGQPWHQGPQRQPAASVQSTQGQPRYQGPNSQPAIPTQSAWGQPRQQAPGSQPAPLPTTHKPPPTKDPVELSSRVKDLSIQPSSVSTTVQYKSPPSTASIAMKHVLSSPASSEKPTSMASSSTQSLAKKEPDGIDKKSLTDSKKNQLMSLIPKRRNPNSAGSKGRRIKVYTNMVSIIFNSKFAISATHYDLKFDPDKPKFLKRLAFNALRTKHFPRNFPAYDGRVNVYSAGDLPFGEEITDTVEIFDHERQSKREVKVTMKKVNEINLSWLKDVRPGIEETERDQQTIQVLDIILRSAPFNRAIQVGRSFFHQPKSNICDLSGGMELYNGIFQSAILGWKPYFNIDVAHKAFPKSIPVIEIMKDLCADRNGPPPVLTANIVQNNLLEISKFLKGLKVIYELPNKPNSKRTIGVNGLDKSPSTAVFELDNGTKATVQQYFRGSKNYDIRNVDLPCLWVGSRNKRILIPPELCTIAPGVITNRKLNEEQTRQMIRSTATPAQNRKAKIENLMREMNYNQDPTLKEFGISLSGAFEEVNARVLQAPSLNYGKDQVSVHKGVWRALKFHVAKEIPQNKWTILNLTNPRFVDEGKLRKFATDIQKLGRENGMNIGEVLTPFGYVESKGTMLVKKVTEFMEDKKRFGINLVIVVIPPFPADIYPKIKQIAELQVGVLTQCVKDQTLRKVVEKNDKSTTGNILLKINSKLNGINHIITINDNNKPNCLKVPTIIFGADVTHPSPDASDIPSIAAVAASSTSDFFKYNIDIRLQPARQEIILDIKDIVHKQLTIFARANGGRKPDNIIFYRDGVSEGQFPQVMHFELQAIREVCSRFGGGTPYNPKITFLVVQKRHHTRFFPTDSRNSDDRNGNVQAGTIVDTQITHPSHIDFYLVSHASIQGTARPTKYRCLWDDNNMSEDDIETLTYYLCHLFSRCTRSVSYPAPTYYAHLAAFRARALISGVPIQMNNLESEQRKKLTVKEDLMSNNPMFFV